VKPIDVNELVESSVNLALQHLGKGGFAIETTLAEDLPKVSLDTESTEQVIVNVIQNAFDATRGKGRATISTMLDRQSIKIEITNDGPPIPNKVREKIFEPLFTTKPEGKGTGLGLSVGAMMLERFGAKISLKESNKKRTTFLIKLPRENQK